MVQLPVCSAQRIHCDSNRILRAYNFIHRAKVQILLCWLFSHLPALYCISSHGNLVKTTLDREGIVLTNDWATNEIAEKDQKWFPFIIVCLCCVFLSASINTWLSFLRCCDVASVITSSESPLILCTIHSDLYITHNADIVTNPLGTRYTFSCTVAFSSCFVLSDLSHPTQWSWDVQMLSQNLDARLFWRKSSYKLVANSLFCSRYWTALICDRIQRSFRKSWLNGKNWSSCECPCDLVRVPILGNCSVFCIDTFYKTYVFCNWSVIFFWEVQASCEKHQSISLRLW